MHNKSIVLVAAVAGIVSLSYSSASAEEVELRAASCFPQGSFFSKRFEALIEQVNEQGTGKVQIAYVGGAPAIGSPFTLIQKVAQGVYDLASCTGAYYQNVVPEADAWKLLERTPKEIRENGGWDLMTDIHRQANLVPLARTHYGTNFHLFLGPDNKIEGPDLTGLHLRTAPIYTSFFKTLGATTQTSDLSQIFTLMENGTVNGYGWPVIGHQPGWNEVTKYRVDPGFYDVDIQVIANAASWDKLTPEAKDLVQSLALAIEESATAEDPEMAKGAASKQEASGFEAIVFGGADRDKWISTAREAGWSGVIETSPENGPKLREFFASE